MSRPRRTNRVKDSREAAGLTQQQLADEIGAGRTTVIRMENGAQAPDVHRALEVAEVLGVSVEELWGDPDDYRERINDEVDARVRRRLAELEREQDRARDIAHAVEKIDKAGAELARLGRADVLSDAAAGLEAIADELPRT